MSTQPDTETGPVIPEWTLADRLRKARETAGLSQGQLAAILGVARNTVTNYEGGGSAKIYVVRAWATATNVPLAWILDQKPADYQSDSDVIDLRREGAVIPFPRPETAIIDHDCLADVIAPSCWFANMP